MKKTLLLILCSLFLSVTFANVTNEGDMSVVETQVNPPDFEVYPNPATGDIVQINLKNLEFKHSDNVVITLTNVIGQKVYTHTVNSADVQNGNFKINLSDNNIGKGIYFIKLTYGDHTSLKKLVVR